MEEIREIKVEKNTQIFVKNLSELSTEKRNNVIEILNTLQKQQQSESDLEHNRGWRYIWQRTPKPFLLMMGYLIFLAPVGSLGYKAFEYAGDDNKVIFLIILTAILILPLLVVFYLSYHFINQKKIEKKGLTSETEDY